MSPVMQEMAIGMSLTGAFMVFLVLLVFAAVVGGVFLSRWLGKVK